MAFVARVSTIPGLSRAFADAVRFANELMRAGLDVVIEVKEGAKGRTSDQNKKMWAMLRDVSEQVIWHGEQYSDDQWKDIFTAALRGQKSAPGIDGGIVFFGQRTSKMSTALMADLIELMHSFGAERDIKWTDPKQKTEGNRRQA